MAITQKSRIQIRRGKIDELPQLASGELGWSIDTRQLFIGNGTPAEGAPIVGNTEILTERSSIVRNPTTSTIIVEVQEQIGHTFVNGDPVYFDGTNWQLASAFTEDTYAIGVVNNVEGLAFDVVLYGVADIGGFTPGQYYYTSDIEPGQPGAGELVTVAPDSKNLVLFALSNSTVVVSPGLPTSANSYNRPLPMSIGVGGAVPGTTFSGSIQDALDVILYPYIAPQFLTFTAPAIQSLSPLEVGQSIDPPGPYTFNWTMSNPENLTTDSIVISDVTSNSFSPFSVVGNTGSQVIPFNNIVRLENAGTYTWRITGDGTESGDFTRDLTVEWQWRMFYGSSTNTVLTEPQVEALSNGLQVSPNTTYAFTGPGYKYIAFPVSFGFRNIFRDVVSGFSVSMQPPFTVTLTNSHSVQADYYVYRTTNQLAGDITIEILA